MITDVDRLQFLIAGGYLPLKPSVPPIATDAELVDWALEHGYCPAYWRPWTEADGDPTRNGMIFLKRGDRERIDQILNKKRRPE